MEPWDPLSTRNDRGGGGGGGGVYVWAKIGVKIDPFLDYLKKRGGGGLNSMFFSNTSIYFLHCLEKGGSKPQSLPTKSHSTTYFFYISEAKAIRAARTQVGNVLIDNNHGGCQEVRPQQGVRWVP